MGAEPMESARDAVRALLAREEEPIRAALERSLEGLADEVPPRILTPARHALLAGGKRLRPVLCVSAYRALGGTSSPELYDLAVSLELIHTYSLVHDDLPCMDDAELRRGIPTAHRAFDEPSATLAGAALIPWGVLQAWRSARALGCGEKRARRIVRALSRAAGAGGMVGGQVLDLLGEEAELSRKQLDDLHRRKTGALLRAALEVGSLAAGAGEEEQEALERYGERVGLAFQIADDLLDVTATAGELGKHPSDVELGKTTYVSLYGQAEARRRAEVLVEEAVEALRVGGIGSPELEALARFVVTRDR